MQRGVKGGRITFNPERACEAVRKVSRRWYTADQLPMLPLKDCNFGGCQCKYKFHDDPRGGGTQGQRRPP